MVKLVVLFLFLNWPWMKGGLGALPTGLGALNMSIYNQCLISYPPVLLQCLPLSYNTYGTSGFQGMFLQYVICLCFR